MTTWLHHNHHLQHPWFASPSLKRKLSPEADQEQHPPRRKRIHKLEHGFAGLTLQTPTVSPTTPTIPTSTSLSTQSTPPITPEQPVSIEEPPEIKMGFSSWYEPEKDRIVITELDDSEEEDEDAGKAQSEGGGYTISPAILSVLNKRLGIDPPSLDIPDASSTASSAIAGRPSQALILFQPRDFFREETQPVESKVEQGTPVDDAMDIEML